MKKNKILSTLLKDLSTKPKVMPNKDALAEEIEKLQLLLLHIQQGIFNKKERVIIIFEGFDAAGKGGCIRTLTEVLDPRNIRVVPISAPKKSEQNKHWLYRFWKKIPAPGEIVIFDRSWYGRVLVEKVDKLSTPKRISEAYVEINQFEMMLANDGIKLIKFFLAITSDEQLKRLNERILDPYKQWKITMDDVRARKNWKLYVDAVDELLLKNNTKICPWHVIPANSKKLARVECLKIIIDRFKYTIKGIKTSKPDKEQLKLAKLL